MGGMGEMMGNGSFWVLFPPTTPCCPPSPERLRKR
jgi:hypothetical protein